MTERRKITVELTVLTGRMRERDIEHDLDRLLTPLQHIESGETTVDDYEIKTIA